MRWHFLLFAIGTTIISEGLYHCHLAICQGLHIPVPLMPAASCVLDVELATQDFGDVAEAALYPVNAVRNRALMLSRTQVSWAVACLAALKALGG